MNPKDLAVTFWALARLGYPLDDMLRAKIVASVEAVLTSVSEDPAMIGQEEDLDKKVSDLTDLNLDIDSPEIDALVTPQTLSMFYFGLAKLFKKERDEQVSGIFSRICQALSDDLLKEAEGEFSSSLQVAGIIAHSAKHVREVRLDD